MNCIVKTWNNNCVVTFWQQKGWPQKVTSAQSWLMTAIANLLINARDTMWILSVFITKYHTSSKGGDLSLEKNNPSIILDYHDQKKEAVNLH